MQIMLNSCSDETEIIKPGSDVYLFSDNGAIHEFIPNLKIARTFEMENTPFGIQLELYKFEKLTGDRSKLTMHVIFESVAQRDQLLQLPFTRGINMAHNRIQDIAGKLK